MELSYSQNLEDYHLSLAFAGPDARRGALPRERFSRVLGMFSSLEVKVLYPT
jgi:hypothetical protein